MKTMSLFDDDEPDALEVGSEAPKEEWREVPATVFLSWARRHQVAYCIKRDLDSATCAENEDWALFYRERAAAYEAEL